MHEDAHVAGESLLLPPAVAAARTDAEVTQGLDPQRKARRLAVLLLAEPVFAAVVADSNVVTVEVHRQRRVVAGTLHSEQQLPLPTVVDIIQPLVVAVGIPDLVVAIRRQQRPLALLHVTDGATVVALSLNHPDGRLALAAAEAVEKLLRLLATAAVVHAVVVGDRWVVAVPPAAVGVGVLLAVVAAVIDLETGATFSVLLDPQNDPWCILRFSARLRRSQLAFCSCIQQSKDDRICCDWVVLVFPVQKLMYSAVLLVSRLWLVVPDPSSLQ